MAKSRPKTTKRSTKTKRGAPDMSAHVPVATPTRLGTRIEWVRGWVGRKA
jgi:hypothetical protein